MAQLLHRVHLPFLGSRGQASSSTDRTATRNDVEMQSQPSSSAAPAVAGPSADEASSSAEAAGPAAGQGDAAPAPGTTQNTAVGAGGDEATPQRPRGHGREISGRSVLSNLSQRLAAMRERDRDQDYSMAFNRLALAEQLRDLEAQITRERGGAGVTNLANGSANGVSSSSAARRKEAKAKREREENSTLFGPNLAHYFGSGSSSSGSVSAASMSTGPAGNPTSHAADGSAGPNAPETPGSWGRSSARLGSRGRARGASLSGLTNLSTIPTQGATNSTNEIPETPGFTPSALPVETPGPNDGPAPPTAASASAVASSVAMAEGIDIEVLKSWIERSVASNGGAVEIDGEGEEAVEKAMKTASSCTTLQSLVNLKRNTINLMVKSGELGVGVGAAAGAAPGDHPLSGSGEGEGGGEGLHIVQESDLRPARSLSAMPTFGASTSDAGASMVGTTTHNLHFEYDCTSSSASIQVFLRASRKHGSWASWLQSQQGRQSKETEEAEDDEEAAASPAPVDLLAAGAGDSLYHKWGAAPHVLGWPVHSSRVRRGFAQPVKAGLSLRLNLYAPPSKSSSSATAPPSAPGGAMFTIDGEQSEGTAPAPASTAAPGLAAIPDDETKEQRLAREKAERETLKLAIVVEALDEHGKPFAEPNLQTTYLRLTSLPVRPPTNTAAEESTTEASAAAPPARIWAAHVEGQEAEIGPHRFQLQELYGLSSRPPPVEVEAPPAGEEGGDGTTGTTAAPLLDPDNGGSSGSECLICLSSPTNTLLLPCTHGLCLDCSVQLKESVRQQRESERRRGKPPKKRWNCPMCRRGFTAMLHLGWGVEGGSEGKEGEPTVERME
ncbi:hypothetical protein BDZ90DRAFT_231855 [Jaminaea rosea]|uniref:RING-type domain-containing protein n=1 Tax=Jaminaea rosea TaxID=1569628 RepID=A0A316USX1_9BASI|nr:hypothetical protein BDZ90DRAFT_231855 [Jaminaea rosea]PWN28094.1 hypothetical protein BDZ90DRAFT_231855 [Jaminaea rosea]